MANTSGVTEAAGVAVAERVSEARALWMSTLPTIRRAPVRDRLPQLARTAVPEVATEPIATPAVAVVGSIAATYGPIGDLAISADGRRLVATHYGSDVVSLVDPVSMSVTAAIEGIAEPHSAVVVADRAYVGCASLEDDYVLAVDTRAGTALAAKQVGPNVGGLAVSRSGAQLYVARTGEDGADIAVIDVESGRTETVTVGSGVSLGAVRVSADGTRLFAAMTTPAGGALAIVDLKARVVRRTVALGDSVGDIAVHPGGRTVYATGWDAEHGGVIRVVDIAAARVTGTIRLGGLPTQLVFALGGAVAFVVDREEIVVVGTAAGEILDSIAVGGQPSCLAAGPDGTLYVAGYDGDITVLRVAAGGAHGRFARPRQLTAAAS